MTECQCREGRLKVWHCWSLKLGLPAGQGRFSHSLYCILEPTQSRLFPLVPTETIQNKMHGMKVKIK